MIARRCELPSGSFSSLLAIAWPQRHIKSEMAAHIGEALRLLREAHGLTQIALGSRVGIAQKNLSRIERTGEITVRTARRILGGLGPYDLMIGVTPPAVGPQRTRTGRSGGAPRSGRKVSRR